MAKYDEADALDLGADDYLTKTVFRMSCCWRTCGR